MPHLFKASADQIRTAYAELKSIYAVAVRFGMCPQSVQERLVKLNIPRTCRPVVGAEAAAITALYRGGFTRGDGSVERLAKRFGRSIWVIYGWASVAGLCNSHRPQSQHLLIKMIKGSRASIKRRQANGTYRNSMQGTVCSVERRRIISLQSKTRWHSRTKAKNAEIVTRAMRTKLRKYGRVGNLTRPGVTTWKAGWRTVGDRRIYARSRWEANYARYLELLKSRGEIKEWEHEAETFWFGKMLRGARSYMPDFRVTLANGKIEYHEVKGWMDHRSKTKIRRMKKYHPKIVLRIFGAKWYRANAPSLREIIPDWEHDKPRKAPALL